MRSVVSEKAAYDCLVAIISDDILTVDLYSVSIVPSAFSTESVTYLTCKSYLSRPWVNRERKNIICVSSNLNDLNNCASYQ